MAAAVLVLAGMATAVPVAHIAAQAQATPKGQWPAQDWPPGWKLYDPYPEELSFVAPEATTKLATEVRTLKSDITDEKKFKGVVISQRILIDNPYLEPDDPFFNIPRQIACLPDGSVAVASTAKQHKDGRFKGNPYAAGFWRIAPDGAITPISAKHVIMENSGYYPSCGLPFQKTSIQVDIKPMTLAPDGSLLFAYESGVRRLRMDGRVEAVPNRPEACAKDPQPSPASSAAFQKPEAVVQDPRGDVWVAGGCRLSRMTPDGSVTEVLGPAQMCPADEPEHHIRGEFLAWDTVHDELVMSGTLTWFKSPKANTYSMIYRVRPDGTPRRVFLGVKLGKTAPRVDGISGLAVDANGAIVVGAGVNTGNGYQVVRIDEGKGLPVFVAGAPSMTDDRHGDGPARQAHFGTFRSLCFAPDGTLYIDDANHLIRKLTTQGEVTTWAF